MSELISRQKLIEELNIIEKFYLHDDNEICSMSGHECYPQDECPLCMLERIRNFINSQPPADQWIPCSERLPDKGGTYIVTQERYRLDDRLYKKPVVVETTFAEFNFMDDVWNRARHLKVTAWMPLPEPYKEE